MGGGIQSHNTAGYFFFFYEKSVSEDVAYKCYTNDINLLNEICIHNGGGGVWLK